jgi:hypothetical protein
VNLDIEHVLYLGALCFVIYLLINMFRRYPGALAVGLPGFIPAAIFFFASLGTAIFSVWWGAVGYVAAIYVATGLILLSCSCVRLPPDPTGVRKNILSREEEALFKKYRAFFRYPLGANNFATFVNFARMFGLVWIVIGLWQGMYWAAIANAVFYLISSSVMWRLAPLAHYKEAAERGHAFAFDKLAEFQNILDNRDELGF